MPSFLRLTNLALTLLVISLFSACSQTRTISIEQPQLASDAQGQNRAERFYAAAVETDLTPPPGMSMGGYSLMAKKGQGFRTRIKARVVYLNNGSKDKPYSTALVQTDLASGSLLLHHLVTSKVSQVTGLQAKDIVITATHSHSSVANQFNNEFYNKHFSSQIGLAQDYLAFSAEQISRAIIQAYQQQRPAKIATGRKDLYGYNRNRSLGAYKLNPGHEAIDLDDLKAVFEAVNPALQMIRIDAQTQRGDYKPLAAFSSFAIHATAFSGDIDIYNADLYAYAQKELEWFIADKHQTPWQVLHALTTSTQGDMAPALKEEDNWTHHAPLDWLATRRLGQKLGQEAIMLFESLAPQLQSELTLATAAREININEENQIDDIELCQTPYVGNALTGGAYERRTKWVALVPFLRGGSGHTTRNFFTDGCQGNKRIIGTKLLQPLFEPTETFPKTVMFQIVRINDTAILPLPFEITAEAGRRIADGVKHSFNQNAQDIKHSWITSVSNGYFGYSASEHEYAYQAYEGGHTLYGRYSSPYLGAQLKRLAKDMLNSEAAIQELLPKWHYQLKSKNFLPVAEPVEGSRALLSAPQFYPVDGDKESYWQLSWLDNNPGEMQFHRPLVRIETRTNDQAQWRVLKLGQQIIDDNGYDLEVRLLELEDAGMAKYQLRWYLNQAAQKQLDFANQQYRAVILAREQQADFIININ